MSTKWGTFYPKEDAYQNRILKSAAGVGMGSLPKINLNRENDFNLAKSRYEGGKDSITSLDTHIKRNMYPTIDHSPTHEKLAYG